MKLDLRDSTTESKFRPALTVSGERQEVVVEVVSPDAMKRERGSFRGGRGIRGGGGGRE